MRGNEGESALCEVTKGSDTTGNASALSWLAANAGPNEFSETPGEELPTVTTSASLFLFRSPNAAEAKSLRPAANTGFSRHFSPLI